MFVYIHKLGARPQSVPIDGVGRGLLRANVSPFRFVKTFVKIYRVYLFINLLLDFTLAVDKKFWSSLSL